MIKSIPITKCIQMMKFIQIHKLLQATLSLCLTTALVTSTNGIVAVAEVSNVHTVASQSASESPTVLGQVNTAQGIPETAYPTTAWPTISARAAVVMDMNTGTVVYSKNPLEVHYPASITKILTAKIALDKGQLSDKLTTSKLATEQDGNRVYLVAGEVEPLQKLLYGLLMDSGNDAAVVIAEHYGGSVQHFAELMNQTAVSLGATHSHFDNPNGLPDPNHVTTAYDMALIAKSAMQNPEFRRIVSTKVYDWHGEKWTATLYNLNRMLFDYPGAIGVKTGYTVNAHETLVVAATRGDTTFLTVLLDAPLRQGIRDDATHLLDFAFNHYMTQTLVQQGSIVGEANDPRGHQIALTASKSVVATVPFGHPLSATAKTLLPRVSESMAKGTLYGTYQITTAVDQTAVPLQLTGPLVVPQAAPQASGPWWDVLFVLGCAALLGTVARLIQKRARHSPISS